MIITLNGGSGAGKSTIANILEKEFGFRKMSWTCNLRRHVASTSEFRSIAPKNYFNRSGFVEADKPWEAESGFLEALIKLPYSVSRECRFRTIGEMLDYKYRNENVVVENSRRSQELIALQVFGGHAIYVQCDNPRRPQQVSDKWLVGWDNFDRTIANNGDMTELAATVAQLVGSLA